MFQRVGAVAYKENLDNTIALCRALDNPQNKFKSIHVAGTNGKGSSSHTLAAILQSADYKTGLYTSPHLKEFTERIRLNGIEIDKQFVCDFVEKMKPSIEKIKPSFFEITVAMAFDYFASRRVDIAVIEVGLGGRLDSTNVIKPVVSLITNISFDHKDILGDTLMKIASEKAGIIKPKVPVVISELQPEVSNVFLEKAEKEKAPIIFAEDLVSLKGSSPFDVYMSSDLIINQLSPQLQGIYQKKNLPGVLAVISELKKLGFSISNNHIRHGIENVESSTGLKGRWQKLQDYPTIICDTAHNEAGVLEIVKQIDQQKFGQLHMVWGMVKEKEIEPILALLPKQAHYYFCQAKIPRALDANLLAQKAFAHGLIGEIIPDVNDAMLKATLNSSSSDLIFVGGSTFVVAEISNL
jgi:dihydrofolate synthase/folylpolyglutamate synthase